MERSVWSSPLLLEDSPVILATRCVEGHHLIHFNQQQLISELSGYRNGYNCDMCEKHYTGASYHCTDCEYDLCGHCYRAKEKFVETADALMLDKKRVELLQCLPRLQRECCNDVNHRTENYSVDGKTQDLIDPSLNVNDCFVPSIFEVDWKLSSVKIKSEIQNLYFYENQKLYQMIEYTFARMLPLFASVSPRLEKQSSMYVIVKMQDYQISGDGGTFTGNFHHEGLGNDYIGAVGIYVMEVSKEYSAPQILCVSNNWERQSYATQKKNVETSEGSAVVFTNEADKSHQLLEITNKGSGNGTRKVLIFWVIDPRPHISERYYKRLQTDDKILNYRKKCERVSNYWYRTHCNVGQTAKYGISHLMAIINNYVCGDESFVAEKKQMFHAARKNQKPSMRKDDFRLYQPPIRHRCNMD